MILRRGSETKPATWADARTGRQFSHAADVLLSLIAICSVTIPMAIPMAITVAKGDA